MTDQYPKVSFEFFPPKSIDLSFRLWSTLHELSAFSPEFVSVTYGAGGKTRKLTQETTAAISKAYDFPTAAHLTCVGASKRATQAVARSYLNAGVQHLVALRGDPPLGTNAFIPHPDGYESSCDLVSDMAKLGFKDIYVAAYPESHPEASSNNTDIDWLKQKFDTGATAAISQFFFDSEMFLRFRDRCAKAGIDRKIIPGILPIENWESTCRFASRCGASIPSALARQFDHANTDEMRRILSVAVAVDLCDDLMKEGINQFHFYTLNRPERTRDTCLALRVPQLSLTQIAA